MLSVAQAMQRRGSAGVPLPTVYPSLEQRGANICRSMVTLVVGPPSAGKSLLTMNLLAKMGVPALAFLLDTNELTASARFASILTEHDFGHIKTKIIDGDGDYYHDALLNKASHVQASFYAPSADDVRLEMEAFEQRYGLPPEVVLIDNLGNQAGQFDNEWAVLKALTLEYDALAKESQSAIICTAHTTDLASCEPAARDKILGKVAQYPRLILSVAFDPDTGEYKIAVVKNTEGPTDVKALRPIVFPCDPARMMLVDPAGQPAPRVPTERELIEMPQPAFQAAFQAGQLPGQGAWAF